MKELGLDLDEFEPAPQLLRSPPPVSETARARDGARRIDFDKKNTAGEVLTAKQAPHRPVTEPEADASGPPAPSLGLRAVSAALYRTADHI